MRPFLAILRDTVLEQRDRKLNYLLLACSALTILTLASLRFEVATAERTLDGWTLVLPMTTRDYRPDFIERRPLTPLAEGVRVERPGGGREAWRFVLRYPEPAAIPLSMRFWRESGGGRRRPGRGGASRGRFEHGLMKSAIDGIARAAEIYPETAGEALDLRARLEDLARRWREADRKWLAMPPVAEQERYLRERWESFGFVDVSARHAAPGVFEMRVVPPRPLEARHVSSIRILWTYTYRIDEIYSLARVLLSIQSGILAAVCGTSWFFYLGFGVILAVLAMSQSLSGQLQKGAIEIQIARPVSRTAYLLARFASACLFTLFHAAVLIGGSAVALRASAGFWNPGFLAGIPVAVGIFASVYACSALTAVAARGAPLAPIVGILVALVAGQIGDLYRIGLRTLADDIPAFWQGVVRALYWVFPKTPELVEAGRWRLTDAGVSEALARKLELSAPDPYRLALAALTTGAFVLAMLVLSCRILARKEP